MEESLLSELLQKCKHSTSVAGVDEVGIGPLAGPVIAAAVILNPAQPIMGLADSKQLSESKRERLAEEIKAKALCYAIGRAEVEEIDEINILQAAFLAMKRAIAALSIQPDLILVDGNKSPIFHCQSQAIIKGDQLIPAISAASIIAKVARDNEMVALDLKYPHYGFAKHKGYPTKAHFAALNAIGVSDIHRRSYAPVKALLDI